MKKYYCYIDRSGKFNASEKYLEENPMEAISIGTIEANNVLQAEVKAKRILSDRFKKI